LRIIFYNQYKKVLSFGLIYRSFLKLAFTCYNCQLIPEPLANKKYPERRNSYLFLDVRVATNTIGSTYHYYKPNHLHSLFYQSA